MSRTQSAPKPKYWEKRGPTKMQRTRPTWYYLAIVKPDATHHLDAVPMRTLHEAIDEAVQMQMEIDETYILINGMAPTYINILELDENKQRRPDHPIYHTTWPGRPQIGDHYHRHYEGLDQWYEITDSGILGTEMTLREIAPTPGNIIKMEPADIVKHMRRIDRWTAPQTPSTGK